MDNTNAITTLTTQMTNLDLSLVKNSKSHGSQFLSLPREVRDEIYLAVLDDGRGHRDILSLLRVCKTTYNDIIARFQRDWESIMVTGQAVPIFRHPRAYGQFHLKLVSNLSMTLSTRHTELEFLRLRDVEILVTIPSIGSQAQVLSGIRHSLCDIAKALKKSPSIQRVWLMVWAGSRGSWVFGSPHRSSEIKRGLRAIITAAALMRMKLTFQFDGNVDDPHEDAMVKWAILKGKEDGLAVRDIRLFESQKNESLWRYGVSFINKFPKKPVRPYVWIPECRSCMALFATKDDLKTHLKGWPKHKRPFQQKTYNLLEHKEDVRGYHDRFQCPVCAKCFKEQSELVAHRDAEGHTRTAPVPRWQEDNDWWEQRWTDAERTNKLFLLGGRVA